MQQQDYPKYTLNGVTYSLVGNTIWATQTSDYGKEKTTGYATFDQEANTWRHITGNQQVNPDILRELGLNLSAATAPGTEPRTIVNNNTTNNYYMAPPDNPPPYAPHFAGYPGMAETYLHKKFEQDPFEKAVYIIFGLAAFAFLAYAADKTSMDLNASGAEAEARDALELILVGLGSAMTFGFGALAFIKSRELNKLKLKLMSGNTGKGSYTDANIAQATKYGNRADAALLAALIFGLAFAGTATAMYTMDSADFNFGYLIAAPLTAIAASIYMHYADKQKASLQSKELYVDKNSVTDVAMKNWLAATLILAGLAMMIYSGEGMMQFAGNNNALSTTNAEGYVDIIRTVIVWSGSLMIGGGLLKYFEMQNEARDQFRNDGCTMKTNLQGYTSAHLYGSYVWLALSAISGAGFYVITQDQNAEGLVKIIGQALAAIACAGFLIAGTCAKDDMKENTAPANKKLGM